MEMKAYEMTTSCKTTLKVGDVLNNKWVILGFIDKGGMGEVYRAHQSNLNRDVAIKVVSREWLESIDEGDEEAESQAEAPVLPGGPFFAGHRLRSRSPGRPWGFLAVSRAFGGIPNTRFMG